MAGRNKQPINLILLKGKSHLTKEQIEERTKTEVKAPADDVKPPDYLTGKLKKEFLVIATELKRIDLITNLDVDALARFLLAREQYVRLTKELRTIPPTITIENPDTGKKVKVANENYGDTLLAQDKLFKQCRAASADLGLTITSRCKLVVPKKPEEKQPTEEERLFGGV